MQWKAENCHLSTILDKKFHGDIHFFTQHMTSLGNTGNKDFCKINITIKFLVENSA